MDLKKNFDEMVYMVTVKIISIWMIEHLLDVILNEIIVKFISLKFNLKLCYLCFDGFTLKTNLIDEKLSINFFFCYKGRQSPNKHYSKILRGKKSQQHPAK